MMKGQADFPFDAIIMFIGNSVLQFWQGGRDIPRISEDSVEITNH